MNKHAILVFFFLIFSFVLSACQQKPEWAESKNQEDIPSSSDGITIQLEKEQYATKDIEIKFTLRNESETTFLYGTYFSLEKNINGVWYEVPLKEGMAFSDIGYYLLPDQTESDTIYLNLFGEKLSPGRYRFIKDFNDEEKEYKPENEILVAALFEFIEP